eukprot:CAMPEP_0205910470 /NCGR_PEP_ID=MMETSP1325-20131115/4446_1 /ASSEMBLY_ACC=CAM_ASM_000708 /TAXON_ID=236786 /ORGANISM="Florenciella sp., Strain RCC1007" /LENGTH=158 /DNA_ID=CAMNT_0053276817 /DNA_START=106 /DNA_END=582 /DNA_ORIENTATION=-
MKTPPLNAVSASMIISHVPASPALVPYGLYPVCAEFSPSLVQKQMPSEALHHPPPPHAGKVPVPALRVITPFVTTSLLLHGRHSALPASPAYVPSAQPVQAVDPSAAAIFPASQSVQAVAAAPDILPALQSSQLALPAFAVYVPAAQSSHAVLASSAA